MALLQPILTHTDRLFDAFRDGWSTPNGRKFRAYTLVTVFLASIAIIELDRLNLLPNAIAEPIPDVSHLAAIAWTVSVLLVIEIVQLILTLEKSVAGAMGAQLEVYSLILIRDAFVGLGTFGEPLEIAGRWNTALAMAADAAGAVILFLIAVWYSTLQRHVKITHDEALQSRFVSIKKLVALTLLATVAYLIAYDAWQIAAGNGAIRLFDIFFTTLVFADVLLAIVSLGFSQRYAVVFRNFAFAFVAVLLRLALTSDDFQRPAIGVTAGLFAVAITAVYNLSHQLPDPTSITTPNPDSTNDPTIITGNDPKPTNPTPNT